ncbi:MAG TPA: DUF5668 domain-containing protein [Candidatus Acidoferrales bacterium]|nr:DUF5668 domain-containing protein [Candidatus Acidoferrales bacterium]
MKCAVHADVDATGFCRNCGKALCAQCAREIRGALYCEECLARMMAGTAPASAAYPYPSSTPPGVPNPGAALGLGFIPGLGAVYNGEYIKALVHVLIFGGLIALMSSDSLPGPMIGLVIAFFVAFCCYMPVEAFLTAKAKLGGQVPPSFFVGAAPAVGGEAQGMRRYPTGAIILILIGVIFLLGNFGFLDSEYVYRLWPLVLVAVGAWLLWKRAR